MESVEPGGQKQAAKSVNSTSQVLQFFWCFWWWWFEVLFGFFCPACVSVRRKNAFSPTRWAMCSLLGPLSHATDVSLTFWGRLNSSQPQDAPDNLANHTFRTLKIDPCKPNDISFKDTGFIFPLFKLSHWFSVDWSQWKCYSRCLVNNPSFYYPGTQSWMLSRVSILLHSTYRYDSEGGVQHQWKNMTMWMLFDQSEGMRMCTSRVTQGTSVITFSFSRG